jgi:hypothetical protein
MISNFKSWLMVQTRIVRYFVIALLFHVGIALLFGSIKIVSAIPKMMTAAFEAAPLPAALTAPEDPYAAYRDFDYKGPQVTADKPAGPTVPQGYQAHIEASPVQSGIAEVIGVISADATEIARPTGTVGPIGPSFSAGDLQVGIPGIQGPGAALFGSRTGAGRAAAIKKYGVTQEVEKSILAGLRWLQAQQQPDGSWKSVEKEQGVTGPTALAVLCFLGHGETTDSKEFGPTVVKGLQFLVDSVGPDGAVKGGNMYAQGLAILALAEGLTMTASPALRLPLERAVKATITSQNVPKTDPLHVGGWQYSLKSSASDTSVTGWIVMGLKSAKNAGIEVPKEVFDKAEKFFWNMYDATGGFGYSKPGKTLGTSAVGVLCMQFMGRGDDPRLRPVLNMLSENPVDWTDKDTKNFILYRWYYITQAMFQAGDPYWPKWNSVFRDQYVRNQDKDGHWDAPIATNMYEKRQGTVYTTTMALLTLEVYYRYLPMYQVLEQQKGAPVIKPGLLK